MPRRRLSGSRQNRTNQHHSFYKKPRKRTSQGGSFDPSKLIKNLRPTTAEAAPTYQPTNAFVDFGFEQSLNQVIVNKGYAAPTPIQDQAISHVMSGQDVIGLAGTGTGKTAAFLLPLLNQLLIGQQRQTLIVAPTRELAIQIKNELLRFVPPAARIYATLCIGGAPLHRQARSVQRHPHFVIGTPGRILDLAKRKYLDLVQFSTIILDEVDRMLDMGFIPDVTYIVDRLPAQKQALFFSATLPSKLEALIPRFMNQPVMVRVAQASPASSVDQEVMSVEPSDKVALLHQLLAQKDEYKKVVVFGRTKHGLNKLASQLTQRNVSVAIIHGNKSQPQRQRALDNFKKHKVQALLATDVASRGLDIDDVSHVINFDLPQTKEDYIHRIGRTGRADKTGKAITFVS